MNPRVKHIPKEEVKLLCKDVPYVEDFPKNIKLPDYIFKSLRVFGNTVISNKLVKKLGWNGIQWHCSRKGYVVTVIKTTYKNFIIEVINREKRII